MCLQAIRVAMSHEPISLRKCRLVDGTRNTSCPPALHQLAAVAKNLVLQTFEQDRFAAGVC